MEQTGVCLNCGEELNGKFCHVCGQKKIEPQERTLKHFIYQFFGAAFFLENNFLKNLLFVLVRPGFLAYEYLVGRRKRYMAPLSLFLLINLIYFFSVSLSDLNLTLMEQIYQPHHRGWVQSIVDQKVKAQETTFKELEAEYNEQSTSLSKTLIILHVPILALFLMLLYFRKGYYFSDHLIFSIYLMAFVLLFSMLVFVAMLTMANAGWISASTLFQISGILFLLVVPLYFYMAIKKFYQQNIGWSLAKTLLVFVSFGLTHLVYRTLLFLIVFWTI